MGSINLNSVDGKLEYKMWAVYFEISIQIVDGKFCDTYQYKWWMVNFDTNGGWSTITQTVDGKLQYK